MSRSLSDCVTEYVKLNEIKLSDGSYGKVFSKKDKNSYNCHVRLTFVQIDSFKSHIVGNRHKKNLDRVHNSERFHKHIKELSEGRIIKLENFKPGSRLYNDLLLLQSELDSEFERSLKKQLSLKIIEKLCEEPNNSYSCVLCNVHGLQKLSLRQHLQGRRHQNSLQGDHRKEVQAVYYRDSTRATTMNRQEQALKSSDRETKLREDLQIARKKLVGEYEKHKETPESHPDYKEEWKKFWGNRFLQIKKEEKLDPQTYDYKKEWSAYWLIRMKNLFEEKLAKKTREIRKSYESSSDSGSNKFIKEEEFIMSSQETEPTTSHSRRTRKARRRTSHDDDNRNAKKARTSFNHYETISSSEDPESFEYYSAKNRVTSKNREMESISKMEPVSMISVCRLLVAFETELGSLAPKALDLLIKTIEVHKKFNDSADKMLMTEENSILLEVVKEKMKGLLMIETYSTRKTHAINSLIENINQLMEQTPVQLRKAKVSPKRQLSNTEIYVETAKVLSTHGKKDVSPQELETLIEGFIQNKIKNEASKITSSSSVGEKSFLSNEELKFLLQNFSDLVKEEQDQIIAYMEKLEKTEPLRVQSLQKYVNFGKSSAKANDDVIEIVDDEASCSTSETVVNTGVAKCQSIPEVSSNRPGNKNIISFEHVS